MEHLLLDREGRRRQMGVIVKKCLACGTINQYIAKSCKQCNSPLLADVDQADEIMSMDPMEAAVNDAVASVDGEDDMVAQILREQAMKAKEIVEKENAKEARKQKRKKKEVNNAPFSRDPVSTSGHGFSLGGDGSQSAAGKDMGGLSSGTTYGGLDGSEGEASSKYGFKIAKESDGPVMSKHMSASDEAAATWSRSTGSPRKRKKKDDEQNGKWKMKKPEE